MPLYTNAESTAMDTEHDLEIDTLRDVLQDALAGAQTQLRTAETALDRLVDTRLYDIEYAESTTGADLRLMLTDAARAVRIALVLKQQIESLPNNA